MRSKINRKEDNLDQPNSLDNAGSIIDPSDSKKKKDPK